MEESTWKNHEKSEKNSQNTSWDWYLPGKHGGLDGRIIEVNDFQHAMFNC